MMKVIKISLLLIFLLLGIFLVWFFVPTFKHSYYHSLDGKVAITSINYDGQTYITYGRYDKNEIPDNYIRPRYAGINSGFEAMLYFKGDTAILYARYGRFDSIGVNNKLKVEVFR